MARSLLRAFAARRGPKPAGVAAPSANRFGRVSPTTAAHVRADLGDDVDLIVDGGPSVVGVESTIVDCTGPRPVVLRLGGVSVERITDVLGAAPLVVTTDATTGATGTDEAGAMSPGSSAGEPEAAGELGRRACTRPTTRLGPGSRCGTPRPRRRPPPPISWPPDAGSRCWPPTVVEGLDPDVIELEPAGPADDYARVLYDRLRQADRLGVDVLVVVPPPSGGLGDAVRDRLRRAAHQPR